MRNRRGRFSEGEYVSDEHVRGVSWQACMGGPPRASRGAPVCRRGPRPPHIFYTRRRGSVQNVQRRGGFVLVEYRESTWRLKRPEFIGNCDFRERCCFRGKLGCYGERITARAIEGAFARFCGICNFLFSMSSSSSRSHNFRSHDRPCGAAERYNLPCRYNCPSLIN